MNGFPSHPFPALAAFAAAVALFAWAVRGRPVDRHLTCRRCRYDLFGLPPGAAACPECGAGLRRRRAVRVGNREPRRRVVWAAGLAVVAAGMWVGWAGRVAAWQTDWQAKKPVWWLRAEARGNNPAARDAAFAEFGRRLDNRRLSDAQVVALADEGLALQADLKRPWVAGWGQFIEQAQERGRLPADRWQRFAMQSFDIRLVLRKAVRRGDPVPGRVEVQWLNRGFGSAYTVEFRDCSFDKTDISIERAMFNLPWPHVAHWVPAETGWLRSGETLLLTKSPSRQSPFSDISPPRVALSMIVGIHNYSVGSPNENSVVARYPLALMATWDSLAAATPAASLHTEESLHDAFRAAIKCDSVRTRRPNDLPDDTQPFADGLWISVGLTISHPPTPLAVDVWLRLGGDELPVNLSLDVHFFVATTSKQTRIDALCQVPVRMAAEFKKPGATVDVILRPNPTLASRTVDVTEIWGNEIVIAGVPVKPTLPRSRPEFGLYPPTTSPGVLPTAPAQK